VRPRPPRRRPPLVGRRAAKRRSAIAGSGTQADRPPAGRPRDRPTGAWSAARPTKGLPEAEVLGPPGAARAGLGADRDRLVVAVEDVRPVPGAVHPAVHD